MLRRSKKKSKTVKRSWHQEQKQQKTPKRRHCPSPRLISENNDVFSWSANGLQGVSRDLAQHNLNVAKSTKPRKQNLRKISTEKAEAAKAEVQRLLDADVIRPVQYPEWLANVVMVRKKNGKRRMCVNFTDLNKHCLKDPSPLPRIDKLVDIATSC